MRFNFITLTLSFLFCAGVVNGQSWTTVSSYPGMATDGTFSFVIGNTAYVGGGVNEDHFYSYDASTDQWTQLADVPGPGNHLAWAFSFSANGKGYVVGGSYQTATDLTQETWEYDPAVDTWTKKTDFPGGQRDAGFSFSIGDKGYIGSGFDGQFIHNDFYEYDADNDAWTKLANYPGGPVIFAATFVIDGEAYVGTGGGEGGSTADEMQDLWKYDPATNTWTQMADFSGDKRQAAVGFAVGNKGYVGGGMSAYSVTREDFWEYDPSSDSWTKVQDAELPTDTTAWSTAFVIGGNGYFGTGADLPGLNVTSSFYTYEFAPNIGLDEDRSNPRFTLSPMPVSRTLSLENHTGAGITDIRIYDLTGREIKEFPGDAKEMDLSDLSRGMYLINIATEEGNVRRKFIKQ